jgi:DNA-binding NtrC family response regulator
MFHIDDVFAGVNLKKSFKMKRLDILIVDDEQRYADMLGRRLGLRGLTCEVRYDGKTALDAVTAAHFLAVILDLRLPDLYGVEVLKRIKTNQPETTVIILTGHGTEKDRQQCMSLGAHAFMNKPLDIDHLLTIMTGIKEKRQ